MRCIQLLTLALLATTANADTVFGITFRAIATIEVINGQPFPGGQQFFTGTIVTDGTCTNCSIDETIINGVPDIVRNGINRIDINGTGGFALGDPFLIDIGNIPLTRRRTRSLEISMTWPMNF